jgi:hypothetical protein
VHAPVITARESSRTIQLSDRMRETTAIEAIERMAM